MHLPQREVALVAFFAAFRQRAFAVFEQCLAGSQSRGTRSITCGGDTSLPTEEGEHLA